MGNRSFRKVPPHIRLLIESLPGDRYLVGVAKAFPTDWVRAGNLAHLGLTVDSEGSLHSEESVLPPPEWGRYSRWNLTGRVIIRRDLPKTTKSHSVEAPNWGGAGTHEVVFDRVVWQRETIYGQQLSILVAADDPVDGLVKIGFTVDRLFDRASASDRDLLFALSLLQENVGAVSVVEAGIAPAEWLASVHVAWEILPVGDLEGSVARVISRMGHDPGPERQAEIRHRIRVMYEAGPTQQVIGTSGFARYFGFQFGENLVAFENLHYGNALYIMYEDWEELSKRPRTELLTLRGAGYDRIIHRPGWEANFRLHLAEHRPPAL